MSSLPPRPRARVALSLLLLLAPTLVASHVGAGSMFGAYFETLRGYSAGNTWRPVVGDVDLDGRDDVVRLTGGSSGPATLLVRFGETTGRLAGIPVQIPIAGPIDVAEAWPCIDDLDGDGIPDIVIGASTRLFVVRGLGGRAFAPAVGWAEQCYGYVPVADLNEDGLPDYVCVDRPGEPDSVRFRFGAGGMTFVPGPAFELPGNVGSAHLADLNGDSRFDVLAGSNPQFAFLNSGGGGFVPVNSGGEGAPEGDFNGDGRVDLVRWDGVRLGNGDGTFQTPTPPGMDYQAVADLDEDGRLDLVGLQYVAPAMYVQVGLGNGDGTFGPPDTTRTGWFDVVSHGDFDQDGHQDLVFTKWDSGNEGYMFGRGSGGFRRGAYTFATGVAGYPHPGDLGPGAFPDLVIRGASTAAIGLLLSEGPAKYSAPLTYATLATPTTLDLGDLDGDGRDDVVVGYSSTAQLSVWLTRPDGTLGARMDQPAASATSWLRLADLDDNGTLDLVSSGGASWRPGNGDGTFGSPVAIPGAGSSLFDIADLDGNGTLDLVTSEASGVRTMLSTSPGVFPGYASHGGLPVAPTYVAIGHFDADTMPDVFVQADSVRVFAGAGGGALGPHASLGPGPGTTFRQVGDVNADGLTDLFGNGGGLSVGVSLGTGGRPDPTVGYGAVHFTATVQRGAIALADVDGNGALDLVAMDRDANVTVLLNQTIAPTVDVPAPASPPATRLAVRATPNPAAAGRVSLRLALASATPVEVQLFDLSGRRVAGAAVARPEGRDVVVSLAGTERLAPGLYLVLVRQGGEAASARVCVVR